MELKKYVMDAAGVITEAPTDCDKPVSVTYTCKAETTSYRLSWDSDPDDLEDLQTEGAFMDILGRWRAGGEVVFQIHAVPKVREDLLSTGEYFRGTYAKMLSPYTGEAFAKLLAEAREFREDVKNGEYLPLDDGLEDVPNMDRVFEAGMDGEDLYMEAMWRGYMYALQLVLETTE